MSLKSDCSALVHQAKKTNEDQWLSDFPFQSIMKLLSVVSKVFAPVPDSEAYIHHSKP